MSTPKKDALAGKRAQFQQRSAPNPKMMVIAAIGAALVLLFAFIVTNNSPSSAFAAADGAEIRIPLAGLASGEAKFYDYVSATNRKVRFFVVRSSDGAYRAAADTCDVCYQAKMGYVQHGDDMVCRKCNQRFPSVAVNEVRGGCNPAGFPNRVEGDSLVIQTAQLEANAHYF